MPTKASLRLWLCLGIFSAGALACDQPSVASNTFQGYVEVQYTYVSAPLGGHLAELAVQRGQQVTAGQLVFQLENHLEQAALSEASQNLARAQDQLADLQKGKRPSEIKEIEALLDSAKSDLRLTELEYQRRLKLFKERAIPQAELDRARTSFQGAQAQVEKYTAQLKTARLGGRPDEIAAAQAQVQALVAKRGQAQWNLDQKRQAAPAGGIVFDTFYTQGEWVPAGRPVAAILAPENRKVRFFVPEPVLSGLRLGQALALSCDGCPANLTANISYLSPQAEYTPPVIYSNQTRAKLVFMVEAVPAKDQAAGLHPGQPLEVRLMAGQERGTGGKP